MSGPTVDDTADYQRAAAAIYAEFRALPHSTSVADDFNAMTAVVRAIGGHPGTRVVDLGCGAGVRTREIAAMPDVAVAVGIDHSAGKLALARAGTASSRCRFILGDLVALGRGQDGWAAGESDARNLLGCFDVALMGFVTSHAGTQVELDAMLRAAAALLAPGGRLVAIDAHPRLNRAPFPRSEQYAVRKMFLLPEAHSGVVPAFTRIRTTFVTPHGELTVEEYSHDVGSWVAAVEAARLGGLAIENFVSPPVEDPGFWDDYLRPDHPAGCSQAAVITAVKPARRGRPDQADRASAGDSTHISASLKNPAP